MLYAVLSSVKFRNQIGPKYLEQLQGSESVQDSQGTNGETR